MAQATSTVLVVDDEPAIRRTLRRVIERAGYRFLQAANVDEALQIVRRDMPELVLTDIRMPGRSGLELVDAIAGFEPEVACVAVTAIDNTQFAYDALDRGAYAYVIKPFEPNEILIQVQSALRRRRLEIEHRDMEQRLTEKVREQTALLRESREEIALRLISASQYRDTETGAHIRRIGLYAGRLGELMGLGAEQVDLLRVAAPMHDVGKIGVPDKILLKPGSLTPDEWEIMKSHTTIGAKILSGSNQPLMRLGHKIALEHHEKWNGTGYPNKIEAEAISVEARLTSIVDVFDALTHDRVYKEAWPVDKALEYIDEQAGNHFDPDIAALFLEHADDMLAIRATNQQSDQRYVSEWQRDGSTDCQPPSSGE